MSNGRAISANHVGVLQGFKFPVWYKRDSIANILALSDLLRERRVKMDSSKDFAFVMHCADGSLRRFVEVGGGLYAHDLNNINRHVVINTTFAAR